MYYRPETQEFFDGHSSVREALAMILPPVLDDQLLADRGIYPVLRAIEPEVDADEIAESHVEEINGLWLQVWTVRERTEDERTQASSILSLLKQLKSEEINRWREAANETSFPYLGKHIRCDGLSKMDLLGAAMNIALTGELPADWPGGWKAIDNSIIPIATPAEFSPMFAAFTAQGTENFNYAQQLKQQVAAATSAADLKAITW